MDRGTHRRLAWAGGWRLNTGRAPDAAPDVVALRAALPDGARVACDLAHEAASDPTAANIDGLLAQLYGLQRLALALRAVVGQGAA